MPVIKKLDGNSATKVHSRYFGGKTIGNLGFCTSWAVCRYGTDRQWLEISNVDLPLEKAGGKLRGRKIVQISDLHHSKTVSSRYLTACVKRVNALKPDMIVMTGDYVTHDFTGRYSEKVVEIISQLNAPSGVYACLGNHDYGVDGFFSKLRSNRLDELIDNMRNAGIRLLRNDSAEVEIAGEPIYLVGLGDMWANDFGPDKSFEKVRSDLPVIALTHNPDSIEYLKNHHFDAAFCGHTHGSKYIFSPSGSWPFVKKTHHEYHCGLYHFANKSFYVNRGLGRLGRARFDARPEITVYNLQ